jgi:hypothetical protein
MTDVNQKFIYSSNYTDKTSNNIINYITNLTNTTLGINNLQVQNETILANKYLWNETILEPINHLSAINQVYDNNILQQLDGSLFRYFYLTKRALREVITKTTIPSYNPIVVNNVEYLSANIAYYELYKKWYGLISASISSASTGGFKIVDNDTTQTNQYNSQINISFMMNFPDDIALPTIVSTVSTNAMPVITAWYNDNTAGTFAIVFGVHYKYVNGVATNQKRRFITITRTAFNNTTNTNGWTSFTSGYEDYKYYLPETMSYEEYHYWSFNINRNQFWIYCDGILVFTSGIINYSIDNNYYFGIRHLYLDDRPKDMMRSTNNNFIDYNNLKYQFSDLYYFKRYLTITEILSLSKYHLSQMNNTRVYGKIECDEIITNSIRKFDYTEKDFKKLTYEISQTSNLQSALDGKEPLINLTADKVVITNANNKLATSTVSSTELVAIDTAIKNYTPALAFLQQEYQALLATYTAESGLSLTGSAVAILTGGVAIEIAEKAIPKSYANDVIVITGTEPTKKLDLSTTYKESIFQSFTDTSNYVRYESNVLRGLINNKLDHTLPIFNGILQTNGIGQIEVNTNITPTELNYLDGTTKNINTHFTDTSNYVRYESNVLRGLINNKLNNTLSTFNGILQTNSTGLIEVNTNITPTELNYLDGVNRNIQTQFTDTSNYVRYESNVLRTLINNISQWTTSGSDIYNNNIGNVGIGTNANLSTYKLNVNGSINLSAGNNFFINGNPFTSSLWTTGTNLIYYNGGNVGIGITNPSATLHLSGTTRLQPRLIISGQEYYQAGQTNTGIALLAGVNRANNKQLWICDADHATTQNTTNPVLRFSGGAIDVVATDGLTRLNTNIGGNMTILANGNVGIGTSSSTQILNLYKTGASSQRLFIKFTDDTTGGTDDDGCYIGKGNDNHMYILNFENGKDINFYTGGDNQRMRIKSDGSVCIGGIGPANFLHLHKDGFGNISGQNVLLQFTDDLTGQTSTSGCLIGKKPDHDFMIQNTRNANMLFLTNATERMRISSSGNVGIDNQSPAINFSVGSTNANHIIGRSIINANTEHNADKRDAFSIGRIDGTSATNQFLGMKCVVSAGAGAGEASGVDNQGYITFNTWGNAISGSREVMRINQRGNVGIGTTNPNNTIDIWGSTAFDGSTTLRLYNQASQFGRTQIYMIGRFEGNNDAWSLSTGRNSIIFGSQSSLNSAITYTNSIQAYAGNLGLFSSGFSTSTPAITISANGALTASGGSVLVVQNNQDGGSSRGIYMWTITDTNWGIYMASSGASRSLNNGTACAGSGFTSHSIRFRVANNTGNGFIFENSANTCVASIRADGASYFAGAVSSSQLNLPTNINSGVSWDGTTSALGRANNSTAYSTNASVGDIVLRSASALWLQSGAGEYAIGITTANNVAVRNDLTVSGTMSTQNAKIASDTSTKYWEVRTTNMGGEFDLIYIYSSSSFTGGVKSRMSYQGNGGYTNHTGQHRNITDDKKLYSQDYKGYIVKSTGKYKNLNSKYHIDSIKENIIMDDALPIIELTSKAYDKSCWGVISRYEDTSNTVREYATGHFISCMDIDNGDHRLIVNGCGEGSIWVSDYNGFLENGDYITTSPIAGIGMKQDDDILRNYTVAKITMDCDFNPKLIAVEVIKQEEYTVYSTSNLTSNIEVYVENTSNIMTSNIEYTIMTSNIMTSNMLDIEGNLVYEYKLDESSNIIYDYEYDMKYIKLDGDIVDKYYYENNSNVYRMAFVGCSYKSS